VSSVPNLDSVPPPTPDAGLPAAEPRPDREILGRYRALQLVSVGLIAIGVVLPATVVAINPDLTSASQTTESATRLLGPILLLALGGLLLLVGLVTNAVRAVIVRARLPKERYRGPAILVLLMLAVILGTVVSLAAGGTALALVDGGELSVGGTLLLLTATQIGLLVITGALVVAPGALAGLRLLPASGLARSLGIGLALAVPAWIGATLLAYLWGAALEAVGVSQETSIVDTVLGRGDPTVLLVAVVIVAPIAEELFFRGVVFNAWERERGTRFAIFGSATLFAVIHTSLFSLVPIFALGVALALVYRSTRSLPATMVMHGAFNAISVAITLLARGGILPPST
jgi:membrane protease YdiL (CAAX protease family)